MGMADLRRWRQIIGFIAVLKAFVFWKDDRENSPSGSWAC